MTLFNLSLSGMSIQAMNILPWVHRLAIVGALTAFDQVQVRWIQSTLNTLGVASPALEVDGQYGPKTKAAVSAFQIAWSSG
jgi:hypothetical protein